MEIFLIDSRDQNEQEKIKFLRQALYGKLFHVSSFLRQPVALSGENCST